MIIERKIKVNFLLMHADDTISIQVCWTKAVNVIPSATNLKLPTKYQKIVLD